MNEKEIKSVLTVKAWRFYRRGKMPVTVDVLKQQGVQSSDEGQAADLIRDMATDKDAPITWASKGADIVELDGNPAEETKGWVQSYALRHGMAEDELPWDLRE